MSSEIRKSAVAADYNPFRGSAPAELGVSIQTNQFDEALVVDVITNNEHTSYASDGYNVGMVKFRFLSNSNFRSDDTLNWAYPMHANRSEYPLRGEIVYIFKSLNRFWYLATFNVSNRVTTQDIPELLTETITPLGDDQKIDKLRASRAKSTKTGPVTPDVVGVRFKDQLTTKRLKHVEGDIILEGRSGQSIRFGTAWLTGVTGNIGKTPFQSLREDQQPNLLLRVGKTPVSSNIPGTFGLTLEDINIDASSIWMVTDQIVPLKFATENTLIHARSAVLFPKYLTDDQIVMNSGRIIINAKTDRIIGSSHGGINWMTSLDYTMDVNGDLVSYVGKDIGTTAVGNHIMHIGKDYSTLVEGNIQLQTNKLMSMNALGAMLINTSESMVLTASNVLSLRGSRVVIGGTDFEDEPMVCGRSLAAFLGALIDALAGNGTPSPLPAPGINSVMHVISAVPGMPAPLNPNVIAALLKLKADVILGGGKYASFNSRIGFVKKIP